MKNILKEGLKPGKAKVFANNADIRDNDKKITKGVYFAS